jgi:branched-chain amino acid transport system substrate-binding protein
MVIQKKMFIGMLLGIVLLIITGCAPIPIKIGFSAELTGARGELGVMARNGAQLAVEEINAAGGVNGRPIELLIRDDQGDPKIAERVDAELIDEGVVAIIGHITSGQTAAVMELINEREVILISGSATSSQFNLKDDYFIRTVLNTDQTGAAFADYLHKQKGIQEISFIYDARNAAFSVPFLESMSDHFSELGVIVDNTYPFTSGESDLQELVVELDPRVDHVIIASAVDTALIMQYASSGDFEEEFFTSSWAGTANLIEAGGNAVEGLEFITAFNTQTTWPDYQSFVDRYQARYGVRPGLLAPKTYDIVYILASGLSETGGSSQGLKEQLIQTRDYKGVDGLITIDEFGDALGNLYIAQVNLGQIEIIDTLEVEK